jgi:hypothetical protein
MSKASYPLKLPLSIKRAAQRLAKEDGVPLNQWIAVAVAEKVGVVETAAGLLSHAELRPNRALALSLPRKWMLNVVHSNSQWGMAAILPSFTRLANLVFRERNEGAPGWARNATRRLNCPIRRFAARMQA